MTCPSIYDVIFQPSSTAEVWTRLGYAPLRAYHQLDDVRASTASKGSCAASRALGCWLRRSTGDEAWARGVL